MLTIPVSVNWVPPTVLPQSIAWIRGQRELGGTTEYEHYQVLVAFADKQSLRGVKRGSDDIRVRELIKSFPQ
jgi:hypothetical protein